MSIELPAGIPEHYNFATDVIDRWSKDSDKEALYWTDAAGANQQSFKFSEIRDRSRALAASFQAAGLKPGARVAILVGREPMWWIGMIAILRAGLVAVPGTTQLTPRDIRYRIKEANISAVLADPACADRVDEIRADCSGLVACWISSGAREGWKSCDALDTVAADFEPVATRSTDPSVLYFTSGTTGAPKRVLHTQVSYPLGHATTGRLWLDLSTADLHWNLSDTGWAKAAWSSLFGPWSQGAAIFVQGAASKFDGPATIETLRRYPITTFCAPPTVYRQLVNLDLGAPPLGKLRHCVAAGEPLNPEVIEQWRRATGLTIHDGYGQTETTILVGNFAGRKVKPGSMGFPAPGFEVEVLTDDLKPAEVGVEGEIAIRIKPNRPLGLFVEYEGNPEENARKFQGDYYLTGDRGHRDAEGYYWFVGRNDDIILSAGYRIGPFEVESALIEHPAVEEAAVVGVPDLVRYEIVKAFVVLTAGNSPSPDLIRELQEHVKRVTAPYKYPREIEIVESLPKTVSGKIRRVELRQRGMPKG